MKKSEKDKKQARKFQKNDVETVVKEEYYEKVIIREDGKDREREMEREHRVQMQMQMDREREREREIEMEREREQDADVDEEHDNQMEEDQERDVDVEEEEGEGDGEGEGEGEEEEHQTHKGANALERLAESQEQYIKELEIKIHELKTNYENEINVLKQQHSSLDVDENEFSHELSSVRKRFQDAEISWEQEKKFLLELVEKNQEIAKAATNKLQRGENVMEEIKNEREDRFKTQVESLLAENRILREENAKKFESEGEKEKFNNNLRTQLVEEIERLEKLHTVREEEFQLELSNLQMEVEAMKKENSQLEKDKSQEAREWQRRLQEEATNHEKISDDLHNETREFQAQNKALQKMLQNTSEEYNTIKFRYDNEFKETSNEFSEAESKHKNETETLSNQLSKLNHYNTESLRIKEQQLQTMKIQNTQLFNNYEKRIKILIKEKKSFEEQLKNLIQISGQKENKLTKDATLMRESLEQILKLGEQKEGVIRTELNCLREQLFCMQEVFTEREKIFVDESRKHSKEKEQLYELMENAHSSLEETWRTAKTQDVLQQKEIEALREQTAQKSDMIDKLRVKSTMSYNAPRRTITEILEKMERFLSTKTKNEEKVKVELERISHQLIETETIQTKREQEEAIHNNYLTEELEALKDQLAKNKTPQSKMEMDEKEKALFKVKGELEEAKKNLLAYINSLNALEDHMKGRMDNRKLTENDEIVRIKLENHRLNEENASLITTKQNLETFYTDKVNMLQENYDKKEQGYQIMFNKFNQLKKVINSKNIDELKTWKKRSEMMKKTIETLENRTRELTLKTSEIAEIKGKDLQLQGEEVKLLRVETGKQEEYWKGQYELWMSEKAELNKEIKTLREKSAACERFYEELYLLCQKEHSLLVDERAQIKRRDELFIQTEQACAKTTAYLRELIKSDVEALKKTNSNLHQRFYNEIQEYKMQLEKEKEIQGKEIEALNKGYMDKISSLKEREEHSLYQYQTTKTILEQTQESLQSLEILNATQQRDYANQIGKLKRMAAERSQTAFKERGILQTELTNLQKYASKKEDKLRDAFESKIETFRKMLQAKNKIISESKEQIIKEQLTSGGKKGFMKDVFDVKELELELSQLKELQQKRELKMQEERNMLAELGEHLRKSIENIGNNNENEKKALKSELEYLKQMMSEREKRFTADLKLMKTERDNLLYKLSSSEIDAENDKQEIEILVNSIKNFEEERIGLLKLENENLLEFTKELKEKYEDEASVQITKLKIEIQNLKKQQAKAMKAAPTHTHHSNCYQEAPAGTAQKFNQTTPVGTKKPNTNKYKQLTDPKAYTGSFKTKK